MASTGRSSGRRPALAAAALGPAAALAAAGVALAHGPVPSVPPDPLNLAFGWTLEPAVLLPLLVAAVGWLRLVARIDRAHPANPVPRRRTVAFLAGLGVIAGALMSGIDAYDTTLFSVHMVQHLLLTLVAAPLIALGAPITMLLRAATPDVRRRLILPILHSRVMRVLSFPVVSWLAFAAVMWGTHFSPLFDAALENPLLHDFEHALYLVAAVLFWAPAVAVDPAPWRMTHPVRALYLFLQMTQNSFLSVVLLNAQTVLYPHYATVTRAWGPSPLADQQLAAGIMWLAGDLIFLGAIMAIVADWARAERRDAPRADRQAATELAEIRMREQRLAARRAREAEDTQSGSGVSR